MIKTWIFAVAAMTFCGVQVSAASLLLKNGVIHTVSGQTFSPGALLVENGRIKAVGENVADAADESIDLNGLHVYPGLISAGTALGLIEIEAVRATRDFAEVGEYTPDVQSWIAVNPDSELIAVARLNGVTHVVPVPTGGIVSGQSGLVQLQGWTVEEMTVKAPLALHLFWPVMTLDTRHKEQLPENQRERFKSLEDQAKERRAKLKEIDDFFSEAEAYWKAQPPKNQRVPAWEAMGPFVRGEVPLMVHADELRQIKTAVEWAESRKYKMILAGARDAWRLADLLAEKKVPVVYERVFNMGNGLSATSARDVDPYDIHFRAPSILQKAGVKLAIGEGLGGDAAANLRNLPYSVAQAVAFGLSEDEALKTITLHPAEILGVADRLGSLEPGKEATFFTCTGDILDVRSQVKSMWIDGKSIPMESRHTRLYEKYRNRPKQQN
jgi:imidazolonepropionase-like amidohydrolase